MLPVAPPVFAYWLPEEHLRERLGPVRLMLSRLGAAVAGADRAVHRRAPAIPVHQGYGLTEASPVVTSTLCSKELQLGSVGAALPGHRDPAASTSPAASPRATTRGEIWIRGDNLFSGYWPDGDGGPDDGRLVGAPATSASSTPPATSSSSTGSRSW